MEISSQAQTSNQRFLPRDYSVNAPIGEYEARLDFVMFALDVSRRCFFTHVGNGKKFSLIAYRSGWLGSERPESEINFMSGFVPNQGIYKLIVRLERGRLVWRNAKFLPEIGAGSEA